jgi:hypothetical protein
VLAYYLYVIKTTQLRKSEIMTADSDIRLGGSCSAIGTAAHRRFDRIFGRFAESSLAGFDTVQLDRLENLLDWADPTCSTGSPAGLHRCQRRITTSCIS